MRADDGLAELLGHEIPPPEATRKFLYQFHDAERIEAAQEQRALGQVAYIPGENAALRGLGEVNRDLIRVLGQRCPEQKIATVDEDATIISRKREALPTYEGERGYQPMLAVWAETNVVLAEEFRDGNVPALMDPLNVAKRAFAALPVTVETRYFRGDSACHESRLVNWLRDEKREEGPPGFIGFGIGARMSEGLHAALLAVVPEAWQADGEEADVVRECAEVVYVPSEKNEKKDQQPLRYVGIRWRKRQGELFGDGTGVKHFAVVSNIWEWSAPRLLEWQRQKAGTIEIVHDAQERVGGGGAAVCSIRSECGVAAPSGAGAQRDDGVEETGAAARVVVGATEAPALPDL